MATRVTDAVQNAAADAVVDRCDAGAGAATIKLYTGAQPADADSATSGTLLATFTMSDPAFGNSAAGVATASAIASTTGAAAGTAGWFRVADSAALTVMDGDITATAGGGDLTLNTTTISVGVNVSITSMTYTHPASE